MKKIKLVFLSLITLFFSKSNAQKIATLEVELTKPTNGIDIPISTNLDMITNLSINKLNLVEITGQRTIPIPIQVDIKNERILSWIIKTKNRNQKKYIFELNEGTPLRSEQISAKKKDGDLIIYTKDKNLLSYFFKTVYPPKGIDTAFKRNGFIHPLWSPHGQVLTRIQPPDHYHHYGIWDPWTHVLFEGDTVDFWNLGDKKGTVCFADFVSIENGPVFSEYEALQKHIVFKKNGKEKTAIDELQSVKVYLPDENQDYYIIDMSIELNCTSESPVLLLKYRYGGLGWRATEEWDNKNSEVLTSEGKTRKDADGSKARWCIVQGTVDHGKDYAGIAWISYPSNYNSPEPLRIWPENQNGRGDVFVNFSPTKDGDWLLKPGKKYLLRYRFIVFNNHFTKEKAESAWEYYADAPIVNVKTN
ncbi:MAG: PmoA family protein [Ignavibacteriaceae bacterium]